MNQITKPIQDIEPDGNSPNHVYVTTRDLNYPESVKYKQIDWSNRDDRKWLNRHLNWCMTHRHSVTTYQR